MRKDIASLGLASTLAAGLGVGFLAKGERVIQPAVIEQTALAQQCYGIDIQWAIGSPARMLEKPIEFTSLWADKTKNCPKRNFMSMGLYEVIALGVCKIGRTDNSDCEMVTIPSDLRTMYGQEPEFK